MTQVVVKIHSQKGIETEVKGASRGRLTVERAPKFGVPDGMGFGGGEILCFAVGTCFFNNLRREAKKRNVVLDLVEVEVSAEWDEESPVAHGIMVKPNIESQVNREDIEEMVKSAIENSSVANTVSHGVPVQLNSNL